MTSRRFPACATQHWQPVTATQRAAVVHRMEEVLLSLGGPLVAPARRLVRADSKMLRPGLSLAVAALGGERGRAAVSAAAAVELLHCATLVHDDLIDGADERRGVPTISNLEGPATAVVAGDLLIAAALTAAADLGAAATAHVVATLAELCRGQAEEDLHRFDMTTTATDALAIAQEKAGSLMRAACVLGALAAGLPESQVAALGQFGTEFGITLQVVDDVLDVASSRSQLGKPVGTDLRTGVMSVPLALALEREPELGALLTPDASDAACARAALLVRRSGAATDAVRVARAHADRAATALDAAGVHLDGEFVEWPRRYVATWLPALIDPELHVELGLGS